MIKYIRSSLNLQISLVFMGLTIIIIGLSQFFSNTFMEKFFIAQSKRQLIIANSTVMELMDYLVESEEGESFVILEGGNDLYVDLIKRCSANNISVYLFNSSNNIVVVTGDSLENKDASAMFYRVNSGDSSRRLVLYESNDYILQIYNDNNPLTSYIELLSKPGAVNTVVLRTDTKVIHRQVALSREFTRYAMCLVIPLSFVLIWYVSRVITRPVINLSQISKRMTNLDFDAKFHGNSTNEIGILGENINKMSEVLEHTISELRTANIALTRDIEQKDENEKHMSDFVAAISHDLKTPIALIQGYAEGLKEFINDDAESREFYCNVIMDEANKMNGMVKQLINLNYIELDYSKVQMERFDMSALIKNILASYEYTLQQNDIVMRLNILDDVKCAWGDEAKIEEVINNYMTNAIDHAKSINGKNAIIEITLRNNDAKMRFEIFNTGDNIPIEDIDRIWDKLFKVDRARNRQFGGSGIGLSIVKAIMTKHNQSYGVTNYQNGVMFYFELDLA